MSAPTPTSSSAEPAGRGRRLLVGVVLWVYGISITVFLFSIWGRSVAADTDLLATAASNAAESELVSARVEAWFDRVIGQAGVDESTSGRLSTAIVALPEVKQATADLIGEAVVAMASPSQQPIVVDVAAAYRPAVPAVAQSLTAAGIEVGEVEVAAVVDRLEPLVLAAGRERPLVGPESDTAQTLTLATLVALLLMAAAGGAALYLSEERTTMVRTLLSRLAVSAFTFVVFFRLSAWIVDPRGGRMGVGGGLAELLGSRLWIPLLITAVAGTGAWAVRHRTQTFN